MLKKTHIYTFCVTTSLAGLQGCFMEATKPDGRRSLNTCTSEADADSEEAKRKITTKGLGIRGGTIVASDSDFESQFHTVGKLIGNSGAGASLCTANLIAPNFVLTADHCVSDNGNLISDLTFQQNEGFPRVTSKKVFRYNAPGVLRDIALVQLNSYFSETLNYPRLMRRALPETHVDKPLRMVGFGGYTDGQSMVTYDIGKKRTGEAVFSGYEFVDSEIFGSDVDYLAATPGTENQETICQGDSGSSLFYTDGPFKMVVGVTSLGEFDPNQFMNPANGTKQEKCHFGTKGYFVPSHQIYEWVNSTIKDQEPNFRTLDSEILVTGTIDSVSVKEDGTKRILLTAVDTHDAPSGVVGNEFLVTGDSAVLGSLFVGREVLVQGKVSPDHKLPLVVLTTSPDSNHIIRDIELSGVMASAPITAEVFGRTESYVKIENLRIREKYYDQLPIRDQALDIILCTEGCSVNIDLDVDQLAKGDDLSIKGDYILGRGFYARSANGAFRERAAATCATN